MKKMIDELWDGEISPQDNLISDNQEYRELQHRQSPNKAELLEALSDEQKKLLENEIPSDLIDEDDGSDDIIKDIFDDDDMDFPGEDADDDFPEVLDGGLDDDDFLSDPDEN